MKTVLCLIFLLSATAAIADERKPAKPPASAVNIVPESRNQIIKLTDRGVEPKVLTMKVEDSIVFFLNETADSLVTLKIDYGKKETHCASSNLEIEENGVIRSKRPFSPKDFASVCFHDRGTYPLKVYGLKANPKEIDSTIVVE